MLANNNGRCMPCSRGIPGCRGSRHADGAPSWLADLQAQQRLMMQVAGDRASLHALFHHADLVGLQLSIAAWLHLGSES